MKYANYSDGRAKFDLEPTVELVKNEGMKPKDLKKAKALCETFPGGIY